MFSRMGFQLIVREHHIRHRKCCCVPVVVVHKVTKAGGVNDGETESNTILLNVYKRELDPFRPNGR